MLFSPKIHTPLYYKNLKNDIICIRGKLRQPTKENSDRSTDKNKKTEKRYVEKPSGLRINTRKREIDT